MVRFPMKLRHKAIQVLNYHLMHFDCKYSEVLYGDSSPVPRIVDSSEVLYNPTIDYFECYSEDEDCEYCEDYPEDCNKQHPVKEILRQINTNPNAIDFLEINPTLVFLYDASINPRCVWYSDSYVEWWKPSMIRMIEESVIDGRRPHLLDSSKDWYFQINGNQPDPLPDMEDTEINKIYRVHWDSFEECDDTYRYVDFSDSSVFTYDYAEIKETMEPITAGISAYFYRPYIVHYWLLEHDYESIGSDEYFEFAKVSDRSLLAIIAERGYREAIALKSLNQKN